MLRTIWLWVLLLMLPQLSNAMAADTFIGRYVPLNKDYKLLTIEVCRRAKTDEAKANAIYNWVTTHIAFDIEANKNPERETETPALVLQKGMATADGYTNLFTEMCRTAGLKAVSISGYSKDWIYDSGDTFYIPRHTWCAVLINGNWQLADPTHGAGHISGYTGWLKRQIKKLSKPKLEYETQERFEFDYVPDYFMYPPLEFRLDNLAADPLWQLAKTPMPLEVFQMGDSAVLAFNKEHDDAQQNNPALLRIAEMDEQDKLLDAADRMYKFNTRFRIALGMKEAILARKQIERSMNERNSTILVDAKLKLKKAANYYREQKQKFPAYYSALHRKNNAKNKEALEYFRQIKSSNTKRIAACDRYREAMKRKAENLAVYREQVYEPFAVLSSAGGGQAKDPSSPAMKKYTDSVDARRVLIAGLKKDIENLQDKTTTDIQQHNSWWDFFNMANRESNDLINTEESYRVLLYDSYDDAVRTSVAQYRDARFNRADTILNYYCNTYDSICNAFELQMKLYRQLLAALRSNMKDLAAYKAYTRAQDAYVKQLEAHKAEATAVQKNYLAVMTKYAGYMDAHKAKFDALALQSAKENELVDVMETAEKARHGKEDKYLDEKKNFDDGENAKHQRQIDAQVRQIDEYIKK